MLQTRGPQYGQFHHTAMGGILIGIAASLMLYLLGRNAGINILWGAVSAQPDNSWRWLFIVGLLIGPLAYHLGTGTPFPAPSGMALSNRLNQIA